jgi:hypothetical protein
MAGIALDMALAEDAATGAAMYAIYVSVAAGWRTRTSPDTATDATIYAMLNMTQLGAAIDAAMYAV